MLYAPFIRPLGWMMTKNKISENTGAFFLLLFFLFSIPLLKGVFSLSVPEWNLCNKKVFVEISGDIACPGVYEFCKLPELKDLLGRAGGLVYQTEKGLPFKHVFLHSGTCVDVRSDGKESRIFEGEMSAFYKITLGIPLLINMETQEGLTAVPGIGAKIADAIIRERNKRGGFKSLDEILSIKGIGPALFREVNHYFVI